MSTICVVNEDRLAELATDLNLPRWIVEGLAVEYLDCRRFFQDECFVQFDFALIDPADVVSLQHPLVILENVTLVHNIAKSVLGQRFLRGLAGAPIVPIEQSNVVLAVGRVSPHYVPFQLNSLTAWDMKLGISPFVSVFDGDDLYQWKVRYDLGQGPPPAANTWFSSPILSVPALQEMKRIHDEIHHCFGPPAPGTLREAMQLRAKLSDLYAELEKARDSLRQEVIAYHNQNKATNEALSGYTEEDPLTITVFDEPQVRESHLRVRSFVEPIFFRAAYRACKRAADASQRASDDSAAAFWITEEVEAAAECITLAAMCLEAYINGVMQERFLAIWTDLEGMEIRGKWLAIPTMLGHPNCFDKGAMPFQAFADVVKWRNQLVHYKHKFADPVEQPGRRISSLHSICNSANASRAIEAVGGMIKALCSQVGVEPPRWLENHANWLDVVPLNN